MTDTAQKFSARADSFGAILESVDHQQWDAPTPCEGWSVRDIVEHAIETERAFLDQHGLVRQDLDPGPAPELADLPTAWRDHAAAVTEVLAREGVADREYDGYFGRTTIAATMADFYGWDLVIHGSDVARATGQSWSISDAEAASMHATADTWGDALHSEGVCAPAVQVADDASVTDKLLARLGRDPQWRPAT